MQIVLCKYHPSCGPLELLSQEPVYEPATSHTTDNLSDIPDNLSDIPNFDMSKCKQTLHASTSLKWKHGSTGRDTKRRPTKIPFELLGTERLGCNRSAARSS